MDQLESGIITVEQWEDAMARLIARGSLAGMRLGLQQLEGDLPPQAQRAVAQHVQAQFGFLRDFALEIQTSDEFRAGWRSRAAQYAQSVKVPFWRGYSGMLPLPAMPAQGTQCHMRCGCSWWIVEVQPEVGDFDAYWVRGKADSCQTCVERERLWSPIRIRGGELQATRTTRPLVRAGTRAPGVSL